MREGFLELFADGHSPVSAKYSYEDELHLSADLLELLGKKPDYGYVFRLFKSIARVYLAAVTGKKCSNV